jgi:hypothetical protein
MHRQLGIPRETSNDVPRKPGTVSHLAYSWVTLKINNRTEGIRENLRTKKVSSIVSVASIIRSSNQVWSQYRHANLASRYSAFAGSELRTVIGKFVMRD